MFPSKMSNIMEYKSDSGYFKLPTWFSVCGVDLGLKLGLRGLHCCLKQEGDTVTCYLYIYLYI